MTDNKARQNFARFPGYIMFALVDDPSTRPGWDILDLLTGDQIESRHEAIGVAQGYNAAPSGGGSYTNAPMVMDGSRNFVVRKTQFLMGRTEQDVVVDARLKVDAATVRVAELEAELQRLRAEVTSMTGDRARALEERERLMKETWARCAGSWARRSSTTCWLSMVERKTASGAPMPPPCDPRIFKEGQAVAMLDAPSEHAEAWVQAVAAACGLPVDWHYSGGRAVVLALVKDDAEMARVRAAVNAAPCDQRSQREKIDALLKPEVRAAYTGCLVSVMAVY